MTDDELRQAEEQGGSLLAQISNAFVTMQKDYWGLGPLETKSYMMDDLLLIVMRGGLTRAERTMLDFGQDDLVRHFRQTFENEMTQNLTGIIEDLTGRKVLTYQSQILFDPDVVAELFVFDRAAGGGAEEIVATAEGQLRERPHGLIGEATGTSLSAAPADDPEAEPADDPP